MYAMDKNLMNHRKAYATTLEQEKFGVKVQSHDTISCLVILFNRL
jgi:hypothetical protein